MLLDIKALRPNAFAAGPESGDGNPQWLHWHKSLTTYIDKMVESMTIKS